MFQRQENILNGVRSHLKHDTVKSYMLKGNCGADVKKGSLHDQKYGKPVLLMNQRAQTVELTI